MGKASLLVAFLALLAAGYLVLQSQKESLDARRRGSEQEREARVQEITRSGHDMVMARALRLYTEHPSLPLRDVVDLVNGEEGKIKRPSQGGSFEAWLTSTSPSTIAGMSVGTYQDVTHWMRTPSVDGSVGGPTMPDILRVSEPSEVTVTFTASNSGYCSALYFERVLADVPAEDQPEPVLMFAPGNMRDGTSARFSVAVRADTRLNFLLAVDADFNCEKRNVAVPITHWTYEYVRPALITEATDVDEFQEGKYVLIEERPGRSGVWRIAFEDLVFNDAKLADVKMKGYGSTTWSNGTYNGTGWSIADSTGYVRLETYAHMPDFNDQVIEVELTPVAALARN